jgi:phospho-N-acetylmuramoyl-pentapeptide-transferase
MGGILILIGILITAFIVFEINKYVLWGLITTFGMGLIGFIDDFIKIKAKSSLGLRARTKLLGQFLFGILLGFFVYNNIAQGSTIIVPVTGELINLGFWIIPLIMLTVVGTANAVNLTDGLDGLAAGITSVVASSYAIICSLLQMNQMSLFALSITGACLGFIWFNGHPAQVFMGDVGSLALGGAIASLAVLSRTEIFLIIIGGVYVIEALSVMIQVVYFRFSGVKRIFQMTPIHHHYELKGLSESKVVVRFLLLSIVFASFGLFSFYII